MTNELNDTPAQGEKVLSMGPDVSLENGADRSRERTEWEWLDLDRQREMRKRVEAHNRDALFAALAEAEIRTVSVKVQIVDEGQEGEETEPPVLAYHGLENEEPIEIPTIRVTIQRFACNMSGKCRLTESLFTLETALEDICEEYLQGAFWKFEWPEAAWGTFILDTTNKTIKLNGQAAVRNRVKLEGTWGA